MSRNVNTQYEWVGVSPHSQEVLREIEIAAKNDEYVLITGETGVGKEVVARRVHKLSRRAEKVFLPVNCSAIPKDLAESEFFGHTSGAFTGASGSREGYVEAANDGVLFLDEIGAMPKELQPKLLRFLEDGVVIRIGSTTPTETDVRIIAATNADIYGSRIRRDLFYRLDINHIDIRPLRERCEDVISIAEFYLGLLNGKDGAQKTLSSDARAMLQEYEFPGNVRELENILRYGFYHCQNGTIEVSHIKPKIERNKQYAKMK
ncbi:MAG: sigma-54-dependent Fis family transcriptional regulator [Candidatus Aenigmarchaeota archaeon]|nr:sigma-54-dependent Fis family transcriptional regulator [Candidatus Aenigmarchaeota archaeon]